MAVRKRGQNRVIDYRVDGKRHARVVGPSKRDALAAEGKIRAPLREGKFFDCRKACPRITLHDLITRYVEFSPQHATPTELMHLHMIRSHFGADTSIHEISRADVDAFQAARLAVPSRRGGRRSMATVNREAGVLRRLLFQDLRHAVASHMVMAGVPLKTVGEILGHSAAAMTERYSHLLPEHKLKAVEMLPDRA